MPAVNLAHRLALSRHVHCSAGSREQVAASRLQVLAEKRTVELAAGAGLKLVTICPNAVLDPLCPPELTA